MAQERSKEKEKAKVSSAPPVAIVMGSDSDWPKVEPAALALEEFGVSYSVSVMSAHRSPDVVREFASSAADRGVKVILAAAGGAAHLAGVVAAHTTLPVIGIPAPNELVGGLDSLLIHGANARGYSGSDSGRGDRAVRVMLGCLPCRFWHFRIPSFRPS